MNECENLEYSFCESRDPRFNLLDELIRLLEIRLEEAERRISLLEHPEISRGGGYGNLPESVPIREVELSA